jgi:GH15 family glucan-1,4-alpha-glucosidase
MTFISDAYTSAHTGPFKPHTDPLTTHKVFMSILQEEPERYPSIGDYAFISDCHSSALISSSGSIDWCCMPRFDAESCFGRVLDWEKGGFCQIYPDVKDPTIHREYVPDTMVLQTTYTSGDSSVKVVDFLAMREGGKHEPRNELVRIIYGLRGSLLLNVVVAPRFTYGFTRPWIRCEGERLHSAIGSSEALVIYCDRQLNIAEDHDLTCAIDVKEGDCLTLSITYIDPAVLDREPRTPYDRSILIEHLDQTVEWWKNWTSQIKVEGEHRQAIVRSALVLKSLTYAPTGAIIAAPTTSLPAAIGGARNWDYRYSWIRDLTWSLSALGAIGCCWEADKFRQFIMRSAAGCARELQIIYGIGGERRLTESELDHLEGFRKSAPVRIGNDTYRGFHADVYGELVSVIWDWHQRGTSPDESYWRFLISLVNIAIENSSKPDRGLWEIRGEPLHFVYSKVMCWSAIDRGIKLAQACHREDLIAGWQIARDRLRSEIEEHGFDQTRGCYRQAYGSDALDGALLLLPRTGFIDWSDQKMIGTTNAVVEELADGNGLVRPYDLEMTDDGLREHPVSAFLACSFWLIECLARQGHKEEANELFKNVSTRANELGLFSEDFDPQSGELLGNFPQGLSHFAHISAAVALSSQENLTILVHDFSQKVDLSSSGR